MRRPARVQAEPHIIRVFPRRTAYTPTNELAFVGYPPLLRPEAAEVHVSCTFTWDVPEAERLVQAWAQYYPAVRLGGPAIPGTESGPFVVGRYVKQGVTFTSRGCGGQCGWCLVPPREGPLLEFEEFPAGHIIQDNNFLACSRRHRKAVYAMLAEQPRAAVFAGGLQASRITPDVAAELRDVRIDSLFLAADTDGALRPLEKAISRLSWLNRRALRCYVLLAYGGETLEQGRARLEAVWQAGALPFAQLFQPADRWIEYGPEWRALQREWTRPAAMFANHQGVQE